ncbi:MAG: DUF4298 domain-containing protein [Tissierellia bacterium]|nr:DUF4298 domain-containing protein [Tissierellia bacterium]
MSRKQVEGAEKALVHLREALDQVNLALDRLEDLEEDYQVLRDYYISPDFSKDRDLAREGLAYGDMACGVLTEDGISDLIGDRYQLALRLLDLVRQVLETY